MQDSPQVQGGKVAGGVQAAVQDSPLPNGAAGPAAAERGKQTKQQLEARLDELEKNFATRAEAIGAMLTDAVSLQGIQSSE